MNKLKEMKWLILLILTNIAYWSFSEKYIHNGQALDGLINGSMVSALCVISGVAYAKLIFNVTKKKG